MGRERGCEFEFVRVRDEGAFTILVAYEALHYSCDYGRLLLAGNFDFDISNV
jgi:hypothetical protein